MLVNKFSFRQVYGDHWLIIENRLGRDNCNVPIIYKSNNTACHILQIIIVVGGHSVCMPFGNGWHIVGFIFPRTLLQP